MRPSWMGEDPVAAKVEALMPQWAAMAEREREERERAERALAELWEGITTGPVELTEEATIRRGGLRMMRANGSVVLEVVELLSIEGEFARVRSVGGRGGYAVMEWMPRGDIEGMWSAVEEVERGPAVLYWCEGEGIINA